MSRFSPLLLVSAMTTALLGCGQAPQEASVEPEVAEAKWQKPAIYSDYLNRDVRDDIFYFVLPDRFNNANPDNDNGSKTIKISQGGLDVTSKWAFHGGDMQGLEEKLDYLENMGITAIWMTPILRNKAIQGTGFAHHGYWILDFTQIDPHFGSNDDLKSLIDAAHKRGMKIFFDIITNHTADVIKYEECHNPDGSFSGDWNECKFKPKADIAKGDVYTPFVPKGEEAVKTPAWLNDPKYYNNQGDSFWQGESAVYGDFVGLDDINTQDPEVVAGFIDIYKNIISEFRPDGFRIDTVKHVDMSFWEEFSPAIVEHAKEIGIPNFHVFGEVYSADPIVLSSFTTTGKMPSVLDFGFQQAAAEVLYRGKAPSTLETLFNNDDFYSDADSQADLLMNFLGNHDMGRAGFFVNQGMPDATEEEKLQRLRLSNALMYLSRGVPVTYYGDEQGFTGDGGDVDAREDMFPSQVASYNDNVLLGSQATTAQDNFDEQHPLFLNLKELAELRMTHKAMRRGIHINRLFDDVNKTFAFSRVEKDEQKDYLMFFNANTQPQEIAIQVASQGYAKLHGDGDFIQQGDTLSATLPPLSYLAVVGEEKLPVAQNLALTLDSIDALEDRVRFSYLLAARTEESNSLLTVSTDLLSADGQVIFAATDSSAPYAAVVNQSQLVDAKAVKIRVTVSNTAGQENVQEFDILSR